MQNQHTIHRRLKNCLSFWCVIFIEQCQLIRIGGLLYVGDDKIPKSLFFLLLFLGLLYIIL